MTDPSQPNRVRAGRPTPRPRLALVYRRIEDLKPDPRNPRIRSAKVRRQIERSVAEFGVVFPITTDKDEKIIAGHGRLEAARALGLTHVPTIRLEHVTEAQAKALQIIDNRLVENGAWDERLLGEALLSLSVEGIDLDIELTGFDMGEIDLFIEGLSETPAEDPAVEAMAANLGPAVTRSGDLWLLRDSRVLCGNSLESGAFDRLMDGKKADMAATDQPFNVKIQGNVSGLGAVEHREFAMASGEMSEEAFSDFLGVSCELVARWLKPGGVAFFFMDWRHIDLLLAAGKGARLVLINLCVWVKTAAGMGSLYRSQHELVAVFRNGRESHRNNVQLGKYGRSRTNVWTYPGMTGFGRHTDEGDLLKLHPTVKPITMIADAILDVSMRGDIVLDPFLGSGTTLVAAERVGRRCYAIELDPLYVDVAIRRWQRLTGEMARHAVSGRTFDEIAAECGV
jgi:DNA modification methylase